MSENEFTAIFFAVVEQASSWPDSVSTGLWRNRATKLVKMCHGVY